MDNRVNNISSASGHVTEQISAYLDGALDDAVSDEVQAHIDSCAVCHAEYAEVRATRQLIRSAPTIAPPRAFTLTEEMVARKSWRWGRLLVPRNVPRLMTGSAVAFALVLFLFVANLSQFGTNADLVPQSSAEIFATPPNAQGYENPVSGTTDDSSRSSVGQGSIGTVIPLVSAPTGITDMAQNTAPAQATPVAAGAVGVNPEGTQVPIPPAEKAPGGTAPIETQTADAFYSVISGTAVPNDGILKTAVARGDSYSRPSPAPDVDGGRLLFISLEGLLVALGALFAIGAVVASRR